MRGRAGQSESKYGISRQDSQIGWTTGKILQAGKHVHTHYDGPPHCNPWALPGSRANSVLLPSAKPCHLISPSLPVIGSPNRGALANNTFFCTTIHLAPDGFFTTSAQRRLTVLIYTISPSRCWLNGVTSLGGNFRRSIRVGRPAIYMSILLYPKYSVKRIEHE